MKPLTVKLVLMVERLGTYSKFVNMSPWKLPRKGEYIEAPFSFKWSAVMDVYWHTHKKAGPIDVELRLYYVEFPLDVDKASSFFDRLDDKLEQEGWKDEP